jgi:hypothetical protein
MTTKMTARMAAIIPVTWLRLQCSERRNRAISAVKTNAELCDVTIRELGEGPLVK